MANIINLNKDDIIKNYNIDGAGFYIDSIKKFKNGGFSSSVGYPNESYPLINFRDINWAIQIGNGNFPIKYNFSGTQGEISSNKVIIDCEDFIKYINDLHISKGFKGNKGNQGEQGDKGESGIPSNEYAQGTRYNHFKVRTTDNNLTNLSNSIKIDKYGHIAQ